MSLGEIRERIAELAKPFEIRNPKSEIRNHVRLPLVELTGGEPLLQPGSIPLTKSLCDEGFTYWLKPAARSTLRRWTARAAHHGFECPSSGEVARNRWRTCRTSPAPTKSNSSSARGKITSGPSADDEINLVSVCPILFSWVTPLQPHQQDNR